MKEKTHALVLFRNTAARWRKTELASGLTLWRTAVQSANAVDDAREARADVAIPTL